MNTEYWLDYNIDTSGQGKTKFADKSTDLKSTLKEAIDERLNGNEANIIKNFFISFCILKGF